MLGLLLINIIVQMDENHQRFLEMIQEAEVCIDVYMSHPLTSNLPPLSLPAGVTTSINKCVYFPQILNGHCILHSINCDCLQ